MKIIFPILLAIFVSEIAYTKLRVNVSGETSFKHYFYAENVYSGFTSEGDFCKLRLKERQERNSNQTRVWFSLDIAGIDVWTGYIDNEGIDPLLTSFGNKYYNANYDISSDGFVLFHDELRGSGRSLERIYLKLDKDNRLSQLKYTRDLFLRTTTHHEEIICRL